MENSIGKEVYNPIKEIFDEVFYRVKVVKHQDLSKTVNLGLKYSDGYINRRFENAVKARFDTFKKWVNYDGEIDIGTETGSTCAKYVSYLKKRILCNPGIIKWMESEIEKGRYMTIKSLSYKDFCKSITDIVVKKMVKELEEEKVEELYKFKEKLYNIIMLLVEEELTVYGDGPIKRLFDTYFGTEIPRTSFSEKTYSQLEACRESTLAKCVIDGHVLVSKSQPQGLNSVGKVYNLETGKSNGIYPRESLPKTEYITCATETLDKMADGMVGFSIAETWV